MNDQDFISDNYGRWFSEIVSKFLSYMVILMIGNRSRTCLWWVWWIWQLCLYNVM